MDNTLKPMSCTEQVQDSLFSFMDNSLKPMSCTKQVPGSLFSWKTSRLLYNAMNEC